MDRPDIRLPNLNRDLGLLLAAIVVAGAAVGAAIGAVADVIVHHHREQARHRIAR